MWAAEAGREGFPAEVDVVFGLKDSCKEGQGWDRKGR